MRRTLQASASLTSSLLYLKVLDLCSTEKDDLFIIIINSMGVVFADVYYDFQGCLVLIYCSCCFILENVTVSNLKLKVSALPVASDSLIPPAVNVEHAMWSSAVAGPPFKGSTLVWGVQTWIFISSRSA